MKIAVCISGIPKNREVCSDSIRKFLIEPHGCDVFYSSWDFSGVTKEGLEKSYTTKDLEVEDFSKEHESIFNSWNFPHRMLEQHKTPQNALAMWYKIAKTNSLRKQYEKKIGVKYDAILRIRPDIKLDSVPVFPEFIKPNELHIPPPNFWMYFGVNDSFFLCHPETYDKVAGQMLGAYKDMAHGMPIHSELFLSMFCFMNGIGTRHFEVSYDLLNVDDSVRIKNG